MAVDLKELRRKRDELAATLAKMDKVLGIPSADEDHLVARSQRELSRLFGVSAATIRQWVAAGLPQQIGSKSRYELGPVLRWIRSQGPWREQQVNAELSPLERQQLVRLTRENQLAAERAARQAEIYGDVATQEFLAD